MGLRSLRVSHGVQELAPLLTAAVNIFQTIGKKVATAAHRDLPNTMMPLSEGFYGSGANKAPCPGMPSWGWHDLVKISLSQTRRGVYARPHSWLMHWETNWTAGAECWETAHYELKRLHFDRLTQNRLKTDPEFMLWRFNQLSVDLKGTAYSIKNIC